VKDLFLEVPGYNQEQIGEAWRAARARVLLAQAVPSLTVMHLNHRIMEWLEGTFKDHLV